MEWNVATLARLRKLFMEKYFSMKSEARTDRANMSAMWNKYLKNYDARVVRSQTQSKKPATTTPAGFGSHSILEQFIHLINFKNEVVADAVAIENPDRPYQYILIPRSKAEMILVLGMM